MLYKVIVKNTVIFKGNYYQCLEVIEKYNLDMVPVKG